MQNAKRMLLVDERLLDSNPVLQHFQNKQDLSWKQPIEETVKTSIGKKLKTTLDDPSVPEDVKAKRYSHELNRFLHTKSKLSDGATIDKLLKEEEGSPPPPPPPPPKAAPLRKNKVRKTIKVQKERASFRKKKKPQRYADIDWEQW